MLDCDKAKQLLNEYIEDMLDPGTRSELEAFLKNNPECRAVFTEAMEIRRRMQSLSAVKPSDDFDAALRQRIIQYVQEGEKPHYSKRGISVVVSGGVLVAALYMFLFTDMGMESPAANHVVPASTISTTVPGMRQAMQKQASPSGEEMIADTLRRADEPAADKQIDLISQEK